MGVPRIDWNKLLRVQPFEPFEVRLRDGRAYQVRLADYVMRTRDLHTILISVDATGQTARFTVDDVTGVTVLERRKDRL